MSSELNYLTVSNSAWSTSSKSLDPRVSIITGAAGTNISSTNYANSSADGLSDEANSAPLPTGAVGMTSAAVQGDFFLQTQLINSASIAPRIRITPWARNINGGQNVLGFILLGDVTQQTYGTANDKGHHFFNFYRDSTGTTAGANLVNNVTIDTSYRPIDTGLMPFWSYKGPMWGIVSGLGTEGAWAAGSHSLDIEYPLVSGGVLAQTSALYMVATVFNKTTFDPKTDPRRILILGDSYITNNRTFGWHFRNMLRQYQPYSDLRVYTLAQNGMALASYTGHTTAALEVGSAHGLSALDLVLLAYQPTVVINCFGRNDTTFANATDSLGRYFDSVAASSLDTLLAKCSAYGADLWNFNPVSAGFGQHMYTDGARLWSQQNSTPFIDCALDIGNQAGPTSMAGGAGTSGNPYGGQTLMFNTHPANAGNEEIGFALWEAFMENWKWAF